MFLWGRSILQNFLNVENLLKYFTAGRPDSATRTWLFLFNVNTKEPIWKRVCLRNIQNFKILVKYFPVAWPDLGTRVWVFLYKINSHKTILRNKSMCQSLFNNYTKFQNFNDIFYCSMASLRNTDLDIFIEFHYRRK